MTDYDSIRKLFNNNRCALISTKEQLDLCNIHYICSCNNDTYTSIDKFTNTGHCDLCNGPKQLHRDTYAYVKQIFENFGCTLISTEYKSGSDTLIMKCICGSEYETSFVKFNRSQTKVCMSCYNKIRAKRIRHNYDFIYNEFKKHGCELLSTEYISNDTPLRYKCKCGNIREITYSTFRKSNQCTDCSINDRTNGLKHDYAYVKKCFEEGGCTLLSTSYVNSGTKLDYICKCGNRSQIDFDHFKSGKRCGCIKSRGETLIMIELNKLGIIYECNKKFPDCKDINLLSFDFYVDNKFLIEFDGKQHFNEVHRFGGAVTLERQINHDNIKNRYVITNKIPILHISYAELKFIPIIINGYISLFKETSIPSVIFTNKELYKSMHNAIMNITSGDPYVLVNKILTKRHRIKLV